MDYQQSLTNLCLNKNVNENFKLFKERKEAILLTEFFYNFAKLVVIDAIDLAEYLR